MDAILGFLVGVGLSAACGFRVFVPLLVVSVAALTDQVRLAPGFEWIGTVPALIAFAVATVLEIAAYFTPWLDNALDTLTTPLAIAAGTLLTAAQLFDAEPFVRWSLALIAGGGAAGLVQGATVAMRAASTGVTGGVANGLLAVGELAGSVVTAIVALVLPMFIVGTVVLVGGLWLLNRYHARRRLGASPT